MGWHISDESDEFSEPFASNAQLLAAVDEITQLRLQLAAADQVAAELRAEVDRWRGAVRWVESASFGWALVIGERVVGGVFGDDIVGWRAEISGERQPDRNTACAKVCELLGLPVVLPAGGE